jgi:hypothetical protein
MVAHLVCFLEFQPKRIANKSWNSPSKPNDPLQLQTHLCFNNEAKLGADALKSREIPSFNGTELHFRLGGTEMAIIRCTAKLLKEMGLSKSALINTAKECSPLGEWHANLIFIDRKKCVLFANDATLFNFIAADVLRSVIRNLGDLFLLHLSCMLHEEGVKTEVVERALATCGEISFSTSNNRSVLGSMNEMAFQYEYLILRAGGVHSAAVPSIIKNQNRIPMKLAAPIVPTEAMRKVLEDI